MQNYFFRLYIERDNYLPQLRMNDNNGCVLLFINYVTSNLRACRSLSSKMVYYFLNKLLNVLFIFRMQ